MVNFSSKIDGSVSVPREALRGSTLQDFIPVFAAGNEGSVSASSNGTASVTSPATAKNCITAGATESVGQDLPVSNPQYVTAEMTLHQPTSEASDSSASVESFMVHPDSAAWLDWPLSASEQPAVAIACTAWCENSSKCTPE